MDRLNALPAGMRPLTFQELQTINGGAGPILRHIIQRAVDCLIDDWEDIKDCFEEGREAAK
ncbi:MAG TPA: hypothetical protein VFI91_11820 [Longimicrobiaceae bacterium]|nr:hypothetical protein [Longimicrobiaceae bacterium]